MIRRFSLLFAVLITGLIGQAFSLSAMRVGTQEGPAKRQAAETIIGEVVSVDKEARSATVRTDKGALVAVNTEESTVCSRLPADEATLAKAEPIEFGDIGVGDRLLGRGTLSEDGKALRAGRIIVLSRVEIEKKRDRDLDEWRLRGVAGVVKELNPETGAITLEAHGRGVSYVVVTTARCAFRRYASGSASFAEAKPSSLSELKVGDQLRALGERSPDGASFKAEQIVSGSFQTLGCVVTEVDSLKNEIKATTLDLKQPILISIGKGSALHRIPPQLAVAIAQTVLGGRTASPAPAPTEVLSGNKPAQSLAGHETATDRSAVAAADLQRMINSLPSLNLTDIKKGDVMAVVASARTDKSQITAIKLFAGVDAILNALKAPSGKRQTIALSAGLPAGVFDFNIGLP